MILRSHTCHFRYTLANSAKVANHRFSGAVTTHNDHIQGPVNSFHSCDFQDFTTHPGNNQLNCFTDLNLLAEFHQHGFLHRPHIVNRIISTCSKFGSYSVGIQMHTHVIKMGFGSNIYISSALVDMYCKCGTVVSAHHLFDEIPERNAVTWNSLISGYLETLCPGTAMYLFTEMLRFGIFLTPYSISAALVGCAQLEDCWLGAQVHALGLKFGFEFNVVVGTGLIDMYAKCLDIEASRSVFDRMVCKNVLSWTSMITGYAQNKLSLEAMTLFRDMLRVGIEANYVTYNSLLRSFCCPDDLDHCREIHCRIVQEGFESNIFVSVTLVTVYSECSCSLEEFYRVCSTITLWDQISWNAVIAGFSNLGSGEEALTCFSKMRQAGISVDIFTYASVLKSIGIISALEVGKQIHSLVTKGGHASNICVRNGLVSMFARCGNLSYAKKVFTLMDEHDVISWNSLLSGYSHHGYAEEAIRMFEEMMTTGVKPNLTTFLIVLSACSHCGRVDKGLEYFQLMKDDDSLPPPNLEHYASIVDLYGRAGHLQEAEAFIDNMPIQPGPSMFKSLLGACQVHGDKEIAVRSARRLVELCPSDPATYVVLSNILACEGSWNDAAGIRKIMCDRQVRKNPGYSWI
ncbi:pentatricopeptide repeat-containing protein At4g13650-like [Coffea arabica]|uniref:Pentatricopeptide repeat-containing protein At4g13650-like n=1 Tax=Coffea arabica TaxID=13443 RepID=A0A6P6UE57_COFAR|nr:pentatricopeptide repeat-containing protein At4g13650-like [Coffea arabica]